MVGRAGLSYPAVDVVNRMTPLELAVLQAVAAALERNLFIYETKGILDPETGDLGELRRAMRAMGWEVTGEKT